MHDAALVRKQPARRGRDIRNGDRRHEGLGERVFVLDAGARLADEEMTDVFLGERIALALVTLVVRALEERQERLLRAIELRAVRSRAASPDWPRRPAPRALPSIFPCCTVAFSENISVVAAQAAAAGAGAEKCRVRLARHLRRTAR